MKKRNYVVGGLILAMLTGCSGKAGDDFAQSVAQQNAEEYYQNELGLSEEEAKEVANDVFGEGESSSEGNEADSEASAETSGVSFKTYDADPGWADIVPLDRAVQIDDMLLKAGMTLGEVVDAMEASEVDYIYDINVDALSIDSYDEQTQKVTVSRMNENGEEIPWFTLRFGNLEKEDTTKGNCTVYFIEPNECLPYTRWFDGRSYDDILAMSYDDVKNLEDTYFAGGDWHSNFSDGEYKISPSSENADIIGVYGQNGELGHKSYVIYKFRIDENTSMVSRLSWFIGD